MLIKAVTAWSFFMLSAMVNHAVAETSVWRVSKAGEYFYIGGTIHLLSKEDHPLPSAFMQAYDDAKTLVFETDLTAISSTDFQASFMQAMRYNDHRQLSSVLEPEVFLKLQAFLQQRHYPLNHFLVLKPWGVSLMLSMLEYQRVGMVPELGVDTYFHQLALQDKKTVLGLETAQQQLMFLEAMDAMDANQTIEQMLRDLQRLPRFTQAMKRSWRQGDLASLLEDAAVMQMKKEFPMFYDSILTQRNHAWMKQMPAFIKLKDRAFILVGSLHLAGDEGILQQLHKQGFVIKQL